jgi:hypothetical protein
MDTRDLARAHRAVTDALGDRVHFRYHAAREDSTLRGKAWPYRDEEKWVGVEVEWGLPHVPPHPTRQPKRRAAVDYVGLALADGERRATDLYAEAVSQGIVGAAGRTLDTAKALLRVYDTRREWGGAVYWGLPRTRWVAWVPTRWLLQELRRKPQLSIADVLRAPRPLRFEHADGAEAPFVLDWSRNVARVFYAPKSARGADTAKRASSGISHARVASA